MSDLSSKAQRVIVVAPYCPADRKGVQALGGGAKQKAVLNGFRSLGWKRILVNSGHQQAERKPVQVERIVDQGGLAAEIRLASWPSRPMGKLRQALCAFRLAASLQRRSRPAVVWIYNPYLFEVLFALGARWADPEVRLVLELEDLPRARGRLGTGSLKTWLDQLAFNLLVSRIDGMTVVQEWMRQLAPRSARVWFLPVLVRVHDKRSTRKPGSLRVGYFGGLSDEKGVDLLLKIICSQRIDCEWLVCGAGSLAAELEHVAADASNRLKFFGALPDLEFAQVYAQADVLVNLHRPIEEFAGGVFPFKLLEAVAHGKWILSAFISGCPAQAEPAIRWLQGDLEEACVRELQQLATNGIQVPDIAAARARNWVRDQYSADRAVARVINDLKLD